MLSLTATTTKKSKMQICRVLEMDNPIVVDHSPNKPNVYSACREFTSIVDVILILNVTMFDSF